MAPVEQQQDTMALHQQCWFRNSGPICCMPTAVMLDKECTIPLQGSTYSMWPRAWARLRAGSPEAGLAGGPSCGTCPFTCTHLRRSVAALTLLIDAVGNHGNGHHGYHAASWQCSVTGQGRLHLDDSHAPKIFWKDEVVLASTS